MSREIRFQITTHSDDWEPVDGIPRWVWRLDEECARLASHGENTVQLVPMMCIAYIDAYKLHMHTNRPKEILANWLETCRQARNKVLVPQDYSGPVTDGS